MKKTDPEPAVWKNPYPDPALWKKRIWIQQIERKKDSGMNPA